MKFWSHGLLLLFLVQLYGQEKSVTGILVNTHGEPLANIQIQIAGSDVRTMSNQFGVFLLKLPADFDKGVLLIQGPTIESEEIPIVMEAVQQLDLGTWLVRDAAPKTALIPTFDLQALPFETDGLDREQIGSFLQSNRDAFLNTAAFQFSSVFFRLRGLDNSQQEVRLNGISMNHFRSGRPTWSQWGGLNDFTNRVQQSYFGIRNGFHGTGKLLGTTTLDLRPSAMRTGTRVSTAFSNTTYRYRFMTSHVQSPGTNGWGYGLLTSRRWGRSGYVSGTPYAATSVAALLEKVWNSKHHSWFTALYTPNTRAKNAPLTEEVFDLKGNQYNPYWGLQNGRIRNARMATLKMPLLFFNHQWKFKQEGYWKFNAAYQWGTQASSRLLYNGHWIANETLLGGGSNPDPVYYQFLPSYFLRDATKPDYARAYLAEQALLENGQIKWANLYNANGIQADGNAIYALYEDVQSLKQMAVTVQGANRFSNRMEGKWEAHYTQEQSNFFARPTDLLGAEQLWDLNPYAADLEAAQNNLKTPNRQVTAGHRFLYDYTIKATAMGISGQIAHASKGWDSFLQGHYQRVQYGRTGHFQNGSFPENSFGREKVHPFSALSLKTGTVYAINGRHRISVGAAWLSQPPPYGQFFFNPRENHEVIPNSTVAQNTHIQVGYQWQAPKFEIRTQMYWIARKNGQELSFYFADGVSGDEAFFVQEALTGIAYVHKGLEISGTYSPIPEVTVTGVASVGHFVHGNNPRLFLATAPDSESAAAGFSSGIQDMGLSYLKGNALAGGPQHAFSVSFSYEDPAYWRMAVYGNYFARAYLDVNPLTRTRNFYTDFDGLPFADYDPSKASQLLRQESFNPYFLLNATAGKSWRLGKQYVGFFLSIQNLLNVSYKTGGFEQGRNANYRTLLEDQERKHPLFAPKYWWGRGTTYFSTIYVRF